MRILIACEESQTIPKLKPTKLVDCEWYYDRKGIRHTKLNGWSAKRKSKTFDGIARAMAEQWHKPKVEGNPRLEENSEGRTSIHPTNELAGILEVVL